MGSIQQERGSGILLHITSLPSKYGIGDFGPPAYQFVDFLSRAKQKCWQILPLNPTDLFHHNSPYSSISAFAGNTILISPELMSKEGFLRKKDLAAVPSFPKDKVDYEKVCDFKKRLLRRAYTELKEDIKNTSAYEQFCQRNIFWLDDFALFVVLKEHFQGEAWGKWPQEVRNREPKVLENLKRQFSKKIDEVKFFQYIFFSQWYALRTYCEKKGVQIIGDIPIYVNYDSADVWTHPDIFKLSEESQPIFVSGVPPDYFSETGQRWGNPVYNWDKLKETGYAWWLKRIEHNLNLFDLIRIDHFRGLVQYWEIPASEETAVHGHWADVPTDDFFTTLLKKFDPIPIIAEDLGTITPDVIEAMNRFGFPGMKVLLFAFGGDLSTHPYLPHNYVENCVVYTGTHDNNTTKGWFQAEATPQEKNNLFEYLKQKVTPQALPWELIQLAMTSIANMVIIPMQDILALGQESRMNKPGTIEANWQWRLIPGELTSSVNRKLLKITEICERE